MTIYSVYVINKAGGLVYQRVRGSERDGSGPPAVKPGVEKTFSYPLEFTLKVFDEKIVVAFGERDGVKIGHTIMAINGIASEGRKLADGRDILEVLADPDNFPISIKFGRPELTTNERIMLASMFHSLFAIGSQLSPEQRSSGIEVLETDTFKLHCFQTMTGIKFVVITDPRQAAVDILLRKMYEIYSDYALKCPFYSLDMPIRHELFENSIKAAIEHTEKIGMSAV